MKVLNRHDPETRADATHIYVGRGTPWGNPFVSGKALFVQSSGQTGIKLTCDRALAVHLYRHYALGRLGWDPQWLDPLRGAEALICSCAPLLCHADVLVELT